MLEHRDLVFLFEHFPTPGVNPVEAARQVHERPSTLESLLESGYVHRAILDRRTAWLSVSPRLFFNVLLRHSLPGRRDAVERRTIHYLANVLALFMRTERLYRVQADEAREFEYLVDLVNEAARADSDRRFLVHSHIGNYALFLCGVCAPWIEHRQRCRRRPLSLDYYRGLGRSHYATAAHHRLAGDFGVQQVFAQLAERFDYYRHGLQRMAARVQVH